MWLILQEADDEEDYSRNLALGSVGNTSYEFGLGHPLYFRTPNGPMGVLAESRLAAWSCEAVPSTAVQS